MNLFGTLPRWTPPLVAIIILFLLYPKVKDFDRERKITVAVEDMHDDITIENRTDAKANEVHLLQEKINELLDGTKGSITINRSGNIIYTVLEDDETYTATFFVESLDYFVSSSSITGQCKTKGCVSISKEDDGSNQRETQEVYIMLSSAEQGDRMIQLLNEYKQISAGDQQIDTGLKRRFKRIFDKWL